METETLTSADVGVLSVEERKTLVELSAESKQKFGAGEHHAAARLLTEARTRFPQAENDRIDQGPDGTLLITTIGQDDLGLQKIVKQVPVTG